MSCTCLLYTSPLPATEILENITEHFHIKPENTLVISSFEAFNKASCQLHMNVIFCEDLKPAGTYEKETSYQTCHNPVSYTHLSLYSSASL